MNSATTNLLQSKFFTPVFNTAIFDGPVRLYFAQHQEPEALQIYFRLQSYVAKLEGEPLENDSHLFVMLYPNSETYFQSFEKESSTAFEKLGDHYVVGLKGPVGETDFDKLFGEIESHLVGVKIGNA